MASRSWRRALVLGGTRSGKSELAERLLADEPNVRYVATGAPSTTDPEWSRRIDAHRARRAAGWTTEEVGTDPRRLAPLLAGAAPNDVILVDEIGTWVGALLTLAEPSQTNADPEHSFARMADELGAAVGACPARLVIVSPEVGLAPVALTPVGRAFVDALGTTNVALASACDAVVLVVAGHPIPVKGTL
jgi:adenosyl cobinamide kinase/adenosyl cobinamide phosphate guanylyltransferase